MDSQDLISSHLSMLPALLFATWQWPPAPLLGANFALIPPLKVFSPQQPEWNFTKAQLTTSLLWSNPSVRSHHIQNYKE